MCRVRYDVPQIEAKFLSRCEILLENSHLASYVRCGPLYIWNVPTLLTVQRTLVVDFEGGTSRVAELFVECLTALPNRSVLHNRPWGTEP